jgi:hypothetical protein
MREEAPQGVDGEAAGVEGLPDHIHDGQADAGRVEQEARVARIAPLDYLHDALDDGGVARAQRQMLHVALGGAVASVTALRHRDRGRVTLQVRQRSEHGQHNLPFAARPCPTAPCSRRTPFRAGVSHPPS